MVQSRPPTEDNSFLEENDTFASSDSDDETERWYYADENGLAYDDSRHNDDGGSISVVSGFSSSLYLVNTSGKIQGAVTAKKDGDDWYWYSTKDGIAMYTSEKDFKGTDLAGNGWKDIFK